MSSVELPEGEHYPGKSKIDLVTSVVNRFTICLATCLFLRLYASHALYDGVYTIDAGLVDECEDMNKLYV